MTAHQSIPLAGFAEALTPGFTPTPMTQRFALMQTALALYLDAERDLAHSGAWDSACDHWLRDAEAARTALAAALDAVCATEPVRAQDRPLRQLARIARVMLLATDEAEFAQAHGLIAAVARPRAHVQQKRRGRAELLRHKSKAAPRGARCRLRGGGRPNSRPRACRRRRRNLAGRAN